MFLNSRNLRWMLGVGAGVGASLATSISSLNFRDTRAHVSQRRDFQPTFRNWFRTSFAFAEDISEKKISYLDANISKEIDDKLTTSSGFTFDQLMELAGLSVAMAVKDYADSLPGATSEAKSGRKKKILVICGPGNNGGDGLVAARHLFHFGYEPTIVYPKAGKGSIFSLLVRQCKELNIPFLQTLPESFEDYDLIVDSLFGYSFQGPAKFPSNEMIAKLATCPVPVISVDIPSGWHVEHGDIYQTHFTPSVVISLTAPKKCVETYSGVHYLGGRFVPPSLLNEFNIILPAYEGTNQILRLDESTQVTPSSLHSDSNDWSLHISEEGYPYFYNPNAQESQWAQLQTPSQYSVLPSTASSFQEGKSIASHLVSNKLVACVNIIPSITSIYEWEGKVEESTEVLLVIKTRSSLVNEVTKSIKSIHSYHVPEVIAMDIRGGNEDYLKWILSETQKKPKEGDKEGK